MLLCALPRGELAVSAGAGGVLKLSCLGGKPLRHAGLPPTVVVSDKAFGASCLSAVLDLHSVCL